MNLCNAFFGSFILDCCHCTDRARSWLHSLADSQLRYTVLLAERTMHKVSTRFYHDLRQGVSIQDGIPENKNPLV